MAYMEDDKVGKASSSVDNSQILIPYVALITHDTTKNSRIVHARALTGEQCWKNYKPHRKKSRCRRYT